MSPAQVALKKIAEAVGVLGWERMGILEGSDPCGGMVIGTSEYVKGIEGALVGAALHGIGGSVEPMGAHDTDTDADCLLFKKERELMIRRLRRTKDARKAECRHKKSKAPRKPINIPI